MSYTKDMHPKPSIEPSALARPPAAAARGWGRGWSGPLRQLHQLPLLLLLTSASLSCASAPTAAVVQQTDQNPHVSRRAYREVLDANTRYVSHYDRLEQRFFLAATWQSWTFRQQRVAAAAGFLGQSEAEVDAALHMERAEALAWTDFVVGFYTAESRWNDLSAPRSIWRIELEFPDGSLVQPVAIRRIVRPDANFMALYPYLTTFWQAYTIRFPAPEGSEPGEMTLRLASAVGRAAPMWLISQRQPSGVDP